jgi:hypothetical protein
VCLLLAYRWLLYNGIRQNKQGIFKKYNELFLEKGNSYDVLFMGSSRAEMHFNPIVFDSITRLKSYNAGISGASPRISLAHLKIYCSQHPPPKYIILNIDYFSLQNDTDRLNDFPRYFPYLRNSKLLNELQLMDHRFLSFYYNPLHSLPYTQTDYLSASLHGWCSIPGKYDTLMHKGYQTALNRNFNAANPPAPSKLFISAKNRAYLDSFIHFANTVSSCVFLVTSPVYGQGTLSASNKNLLVGHLTRIAKSNAVPYLNYTDSIGFNNRLYYSDYFHLNDRGANKFTKSISFAFNNIYAGKPLFNK